MNEKSLYHIQQHPDYQRLIQRKQRLTVCTTLAVLVLYYGFTLLMAFAPDFMGRPFGGKTVSIGMWLAVLVIVLCFVLTAFFVRQSNRLDPLNEALKREFGHDPHV